MNPYEILGVPRDADMDTIKKAYRQLSRKYHPDANINNPNKAQAEEKFKQIQQAYKQIVEEREKGSTGGAGAYGSSGYRSASAGSAETAEMQAAANYINNRMFREAMNVLNQMSTRNGTWYYLHALANMGLGNNVGASEDAQQAVNLEPDNLQFQRLHQQLSGTPDWYNHMGGEYGYTQCEGNNIGKCLTACCAINLCCSCCGGGYGYGYGRGVYCC